jgi:hypothetical protein
MNKLTLTINNEKLDFRFGLGFLGKALEELKIGIDEIGEKLSSNPFMYAPKLMYFSMEYAMLRDGKADVKDYDAFVDSLDADGSFANGNVEKFLNAFTTSLTKDVPKQKESNTKKK